MPAEIALLPFIESAFVTKAKSHVGASGLWQFMPATGRHFGLEKTPLYDGRHGDLRRYHSPHWTTCNTCTVCSATGLWPLPLTTGAKVTSARRKPCPCARFWSRHTKTCVCRINTQLRSKTFGRPQHRCQPANFRHEYQQKSAINRISNLSASTNLLIAAQSLACKHQRKRAVQHSAGFNAPVFILKTTIVCCCQFLRFLHWEKLRKYQSRYPDVLGYLYLFGQQKT